MVFVCRRKSFVKCLDRLTSNEDFKKIILPALSL